MRGLYSACYGPDWTLIAFLCAYYQRLRSIGCLKADAQNRYIDRCSQNSPTQIKTLSQDTRPSGQRKCSRALSRPTFCHGIETNAVSTIYLTLFTLVNSLRYYIIPEMDNSEFTPPNDAHPFADGPSHAYGLAFRRHDIGGPGMKGGQGASYTHQHKWTCLRLRIRRSEGIQK